MSPPRIFTFAPPRLADFHPRQTPLKKSPPHTSLVNLQEVTTTFQRLDASEVLSSVFWTSIFCVLDALNISASSPPLQSNSTWGSFVTEVDLPVWSPSNKPTNKRNKKRDKETFHGLEDALKPHFTRHVVSHSWVAVEQFSSVQAAIS